MREPDVTLTDFALAVECAVFCALIARWPAADARVRRWWIILFASIGTGAVIGGLVHGFVYEPGPASDALWRATLLALGVTTLSLWMIGARGLLTEPVATWVSRAAIAQLVVYCVVVLFVYTEFLVAIGMYLPATVFLLVLMIIAYRHAPDRLLACGIAGLLLTFVAAAVQQLQIGIHPVYFNHNALYHAIQGLALFLIFLGARWFVTVHGKPERR